MRMLLIAMVGLVVTAPKAPLAFDIIQVTSNEVRDRAPSISGSNLVWQGFDGNDDEIYQWDGFTISQITDNDLRDIFPQISGSNVVWMRYQINSNNHDLRFWNGLTATTIPASCRDDPRPPTISDSLVAYVCDHSCYSAISCGEPRIADIKLWDGETTIDLVEGVGYPWELVISGRNIAYSLGPSPLYLFFDASYRVIFRDDIEGVLLDYHEDGNPCPALSGSTVAWRHYSTPDSDISDINVWNGTSVLQITNNSGGNGAAYCPAISDSYVVWAQDDGHDTEILLWDGHTISRITDNDTDDKDPAISGSNVAWTGYDGSDWEIYMTSISAIPEPGRLLLGTCVLTTLALLRRWAHWSS